MTFLELIGLSWAWHISLVYARSQARQGESSSGPRVRPELDFGVGKGVWVNARGRARDGTRSGGRFRIRPKVCNQVQAASETRMISE